MAFKLTYSTMFDPPEELHARFEAALAEARAGLGASHALHVDGADVARGAELREAQPRRRARRARALPARRRRRDGSRRCARRSGPSPRGASPRSPSACASLRRAAALIEERVYAIGAALALEVGKNRMEALGEAQETADFFTGYATELERNDGYDARPARRPAAGLPLAQPRAS